MQGSRLSASPKPITKHIVTQHPIRQFVFYGERILPATSAPSQHQGGGSYRRTILGPWKYTPHDSSEKELTVIWLHANSHISSASCRRPWPQYRAARAARMSALPGARLAMRTICRCRTNCRTAMNIEGRRGYTFGLAY